MEQMQKISPEIMSTLEKEYQVWGGKEERASFWWVAHVLFWIIIIGDLLVKTKILGVVFDSSVIHHSLCIGFATAIAIFFGAYVCIEAMWEYRYGFIVGALVAIVVVGILFFGLKYFSLGHLFYKITDIMGLICYFIILICRIVSRWGNCRARKKYYSVEASFGLPRGFYSAWKRAQH